MCYIGDMCTWTGSSSRVDRQSDNPSLETPLELSGLSFCLRQPYFRPKTYSAKYFKVNLIFIYVSTPMGVQEKESIMSVRY